MSLATFDHAAIDHEAILKSLNLNPRDAKTQALLLVCERYELDPLLKHMVLISGNPYVTRDGLLAVAHRSGVFDGMEVLDQSETDTHFVAKVAVYRKDMGRPFTFVGRFPKAKPMAKEYGPEMAVKVAEVQALRRAFNVTGVGAADERWDDEADRELVEPRVGASGRSGDESPASSITASPRPAARPADVDEDGVRSTVRRAPGRRAATDVASEEKAPSDEVPSASEQQRADIRDRLAAMAPHHRRDAHAAMKRAGLPWYEKPEFTALHAAKAMALLTEFASDAAPSAQQVFGEGPDGDPFPPGDAA